MTLQLPVRLFLDNRNAARLGEQNCFNWWLYNVGQDVIGSVRLELFQSTANAAIVLSPYERTNIQFKPGGQLKCSTAFTVNQAGQQTLGVRLVLTMESGRVLELETEQEPDFKFTALNADTPRVIEVAGDALVRSPPPSGTIVKIMGEALLNWRAEQAEDTPSGMAMRHAEQPDESHLNELKLVERQPDGLIPVDFAKFAKYWRESQRRSLRRLRFVDGRGQVLDSRVKEESEYRVQVSSYSSGHLTLLACGTSGMFMICAPTTHAPTAPLRSQQDYYFPGALLPLPLPGLDLDMLNFAAPGLESVLALVTPHPLISQPMPLFDLSDPSAPPLRYATTELVRQILSIARTLPGSELGYAAVTVV
jgi:hypothetical protein